MYVACNYIKQIFVIFVLSAFFLFAFFILLNGREFCYEINIVPPSTLLQCTVIVLVTESLNTLTSYL